MPNSIDLNGHGSLVYSDFVIGIQAGKDVTSNLPAEIYTTDGTLFLSGIEAVNEAVFSRPFWKQLPASNHSCSS